MSREALNFFDVDNAFSAGTYFNDGDYDIVMADFTYYDFNGATKDTLCQRLVLQPADNDSAESQITQYWSMYDTDKEGNRQIEPVSPIKGRKGCWSQIRLTENNKHDKISGISSFAKFMKALKKTGKFDMDSASNDITALEGLRATFGKLVEDNPSKATAVEEAEGGKKRRDKIETIIIVDIPKQPKGGASTKKESTKDADEKPAAKGGSKNSKEDTPESLLMEYLTDNVLTSDNESDGASYTNERINISRWLAKDKKVDADVLKETMALYNDPKELNPLLTASGWKLDNTAKPKLIVKDE